MNRNAGKSEKPTWSKVRHGLSVFLSFPLVCFVSMAVATWMAPRLVLDGGMMREAARTCLQAQLDHLYAIVDQAGDQWQFDPACVKALITRDSLGAYQDRVIDWYTGLWNGELDNMPEWNTAEMVDAIRNDPLFMEHVPALNRRVVARDSIAVDLSRAIERAVFPLRHQLVVIGMDLARKHVPVSSLLRLVSLLPPALLFLALLTCGLIALLLRREKTRALAFMGSGLIASALLTGALSLALAWLKLPDACGVLSDMLRNGVAALGMAALWRMGIVWALMLTAGLALIHVHCRAAGKRPSDPA